MQRPLQGLLLNFDASSCSSGTPLPMSAFWGLSCLSCPVETCLPRCWPIPMDHGAPTTPVQRKHPTIWACVGTMPLSVWNTRLKLGHLAIRAS